MRVLILAPHFDDAVYSCGALVSRRVAQGHTVVMMTVCGRAIPDQPPANRFVRELHARWRAANGGELPDRQAEDRAAAKALSSSSSGSMAGRVQVIALPFLDAIYRCAEAGEALYPSGGQLNGTPHPQDSLPRQLRAKDWLAEMACEELYLPLAVGGHVDHRIVRDEALAALTGRPELVAYAYADFPYSRRRVAVAEAVARFPAGFSLLPGPSLPETEGELLAKIAAMREYRSQNSSFWLDDAAMAAEVRATAETYWRVCH
ncbi:MAG: PIG-L family deacetylase [Anaerolineaceae bacterium]|nr:PIG-L family deacetylase [Anaerolineaceae bacterium]